MYLFSDEFKHVYALCKEQPEGVADRLYRDCFCGKKWPRNDQNHMLSPTVKFAASTYALVNNKKPEFTIFRKLK